jgi:hypothetical protein
MLLFPNRYTLTSPLVLPAQQRPTAMLGSSATDSK